MSAHSDRIEAAENLLHEWDFEVQNTEKLSGAQFARRNWQLLRATLRSLIENQREDNAPETIAHEVIAARYGDYGTFEHALRSEPPHPLGILNMLKDAAAAGLDASEEF